MLTVKVVEFDFAKQLGVRVRLGTWQRWWRIRSTRATHAWLAIPRIIRTPFLFY